MEGGKGCQNSKIMCLASIGRRIEIHVYRCTTDFGFIKKMGWVTCADGLSQRSPNIVNPFMP